MAKLSSPAINRVRAVAANLLKVPPTTTKPLAMPKNKPGRAPNGRATAANTKSGYAK